jgi:hypothetical protein
MPSQFVVAMVGLVSAGWILGKLAHWRGYEKGSRDEAEQYQNLLRIHNEEWQARFKELIAKVPELDRKEIEERPAREAAKIEARFHEAKLKTGI